MLDLTRAPQSDPLRLYRYRDGIYAVDLLIAAVVQDRKSTRLNSSHT